MASAVMLKKMPDDPPPGYSHTLASGTVMGTSHLPKPYASSPLDSKPLPAPQEAPTGDQPVEVVWPYEVGPITLPAEPASASPPDIPTTVGQRLAEDSRRLGQSAQNLLSAQRKLNVVEEDALRKSFDMETLRHLDDKDRAEWQEHVRLEAEVERLRGVLEHLLDELANKVHKPCPTCTTADGTAGSTPASPTPPGCGPDGDEDDCSDDGQAVQAPAPHAASNQVATRLPGKGAGGSGAPDEVQAPEGVPPASASSPTDEELKQRMQEVLKGLRRDTGNDVDPEAARKMLDACKEASGRPCPPPAVVPRSFEPVPPGSHSPMAVPAPSPAAAAAGHPGMDNDEPSVLMPEPCSAQAQEPCPPLEAVKSRPQTLEEMLVTQHGYAKYCQRRAIGLQEVVRGLKSQHDALCEDAINVTRAELEEQKLLAQANEALRPRLNKALANVRTIRFQQSVVSRQHELLEQYGEEVKQKLAEELAAAEDKVNFAKGNLSSVLQHRNATQYTSQHVQGQLNHYNELLRSGKLALARNNNSRIKADMEHIAEEIRKSQIVLVKARADANSSTDREDGWRNITAENMKYAQNITQSALDNIVLIKASDDELEKQAQAALLEAEAGSTVKCTDIWDRDHPAKKQQVDECPELETELQNVQAAVTALTSAVGGQQR